MWNDFGGNLFMGFNYEESLEKNKDLVMSYKMY